MMRMNVQPNTYSIEDLHKMKESHRKWVQRQLNRGLLEFGFTKPENCNTQYKFWTI